MQTASEKFLDVFQKEFAANYETRKEAYDATCKHWESKYQFQAPFASYNSFKQMQRYYHEKKKTGANLGVIGVKY